MARLITLAAVAVKSNFVSFDLMRIPDKSRLQALRPSSLKHSKFKLIHYSPFSFVDALPFSPL